MKDWEYRNIQEQMTGRVVDELKRTEEEIKRANRDAEKRASHPTGQATASDVHLPKWILYGVVVNLLLLGIATNHHMSFILNSKPIMITIAIGVFVLLKIIDKFLFGN